MSSLAVVRAGRASGGGGFWLFVTLHMDVYERVYCTRALLSLSVRIALPEALDSCQATVAGSSTLGRAAAEQTLPHAQAWVSADVLTGQSRSIPGSSYGQYSYTL